MNSPQQSSKQSGNISFTCWHHRVLSASSTQSGTISCTCSPQRSQAPLRPKRVRSSVSHVCFPHCKLHLQAGTISSADERYIVVVPPGSDKIFKVISGRLSKTSMPAAPAPSVKLARCPRLHVPRPTNGTALTTTAQGTISMKCRCTTGCARSRRFT